MRPFTQFKKYAACAAVAGLALAPSLAMAQDPPTVQTPAQVFTSAGYVTVLALVSVALTGVLGGVVMLSGGLKGLKGAMRWMGTAFGG
jgi:hypothetical protein